MPDYRRKCDVEQLFNFRKDLVKPMGAINALTIGTTTLTADLVVTDPSIMVDVPASPTVVQTPGALKIVGALTEVEWAPVRENTPIFITGAVSGKSRNMLMSILYSSQVDMKVTVSFMLYDYDMASGVYFVDFSSNPLQTGTLPIEGILKKRLDADIELSVDMDPLESPQSPALFSFSMTIEPPTLVPQQIHLAMSPADKLVKTWGRAPA
jgi:hypothetical protein